MATVEMYGQGIAQPVSADGAGRLRMSYGEDRLWESVESILKTRRGTCPLDPTFGVELGIFDPLDDASVVAWKVARAIELHEPRIADIEITILENTEPDTLRLDISIRPAGQSTASNRVYPFYSAQS